MSCVETEAVKSTRTETFNLGEKETGNLYKAIIDLFPEIKDRCVFCIVGSKKTYFGMADTVHSAISITITKGLDSNAFLSSEPNDQTLELYDILDKLPIFQGVVARPWSRICPLFFYKCKNKDDVLYLIFPY
jgi:hypothetical protein